MAGPNIFIKMEHAKKETIQSQTLREHFHQFSLERSVCHDGSYSPSMRKALLRDLLSKRYEILSDLRLAQRSFNETVFSGEGSEKAIEQLSSCLCQTAAWLTILLETMMMVLLEVELDCCVEVLESLKFWHQLSQMSTMSRRIYYPVLHLREGGIRRTALRRAARLKVMLRYRSLGVSNLQTILLRMRRLSNEIIMGRGWTVSADQVPTKAFWQDFDETSKKALTIVSELLRVHEVKPLHALHQSTSASIQGLFRQRSDSIALQRDPESPKTHSATTEKTPLPSPSPVRSKKYGNNQNQSSSISEEGNNVDFGNLSVITGSVLKSEAGKERCIAQPTFDVEEFVRNLESISNQVEVHCNGARVCVDVEMGTAAKPSRLKRLWPWYALSASGFLIACIYGFNRRDKVREIVAYLSKNAKDFYAEHVERPAREIIDELVFNRRTRITDVDALQDSHESLRRMLAEFMSDTMKDMPKEEVRRRSEALDMTVVSGRFESEVSSAVWNLAVGEITRIMLIQVAFIKKELLVAMSAIEDLMDANNFNFRVMATVPAVLMIAGTYYMFRKARSFVLGHHTREETNATLRVMLLDLERALTRFSSGDRCSSHETGLLLVLLWRFRCLVRSLPRYRMRPFDAVGLHSDLDEVSMGGLGVKQRLETVQRIARSYTFLNYRPSHEDSAYIAAFVK